MGHPRPLFKFIFVFLFQTNINTIMQQINVKNPVNGAEIRNHTLLYMSHLP